LQQSVYKSARVAASHNRKTVQLRRDAGQESFWKIDVVDGCWPEIRRRPGADPQIERINLAWRSREQDENHVLCRIEHDSLRRIRRTLGKKLVRRNKTTGDSGACNLKEQTAIDDPRHKFQ
jgi:hypothetical protein